MAKRATLSSGDVAIVDDEDFDRVSAFRWYLSTHGYAQRCAHRRLGEAGTTITMHRFVLGLPSDAGIDHINRDRLDNRKANLRRCTKSQNSANREMRGTWNGKRIVSRYKGVTWKAKGSLWQARLGYQRRQIFLGYFSSEIEAARAYNRAALERFGEYARLNNIPETEE